MACHICGGTCRPFLEANGCRLERCTVCEFAQVAPLPDAAAIAAIYGPEYFDKGKYRDDDAGRLEQERRVRLLEHHGVPAGGRILDFGCATGEFAALADRTWEVWGIELNREPILAAQAALPHLAERLRHGRLEDAGFLPASFDAVVLWDVIEHLPEPVETLATLVALVKPGGLVALSTPDIGAATARLMGRRWHFMTPPEHLGFFNRTSMARLFGAVGCRPVGMESLGKWANLGFIAYKLGRVFPQVKALAARFRRSSLARHCVYVPTGDILYACARR